MWETLAIVAAGALAGAINTVVGSGSLISFPVLVAFGYPPVVANITNSVGLVPASVSGAIGYRRELAGQRGRVGSLSVASLVGGVGGACLLLILPSSVFDVVVPFIVGLAVVLVIVQPWVRARVQRRGQSEPERHWITWLLVCITGVYGGYFSAAQGILLLAVLGLTVDDSLQRLNAVKNVLQLVVNVVAAAVFVLASPVAWSAAGLLAIGGVVGGQVGARFARKLPSDALRWFVVAVGIAAIVVLV